MRTLAECTTIHSAATHLMETELAKQIAHKNDWMPRCAGSTIKVVAQLIPYLPQRLEYRVILMDRSLDEVLGSQRSMLLRLETEGARIEDERLGQIFSDQVRFSLNLLAAHEVPVLHVSYADAIGDPGSVASAVAEFLGDDLDTAAMAATVDPTLYRERKG